MSEKVVLPKEVAKAIERVWASKSNKAVKHLVLNNWDLLVKYHAHDVWKLRAFAENHPIEYMRALVEGYEVEKTPEEKLRNYYGAQCAAEYSYQDSSPTAILEVLNIFNIQIKGVNA